MTEQRTIDKDESNLVAARRAKLDRWVTEYGINPWGERVDGLATLADARSLFDQAL